MGIGDPLIRVYMTAFCMLTALLEYVIFKRAHVFPAHPSRKDDLLLLL